MKDPANACSILIVQPIPIVAAGLQYLITMESPMRVSGVALTLKSGQQLRAERKPQIVILDMAMEEGAGLHFLDALRQEQTCVMPVVFSVEQVLCATSVKRAFKFGAKAVLCQKDSPESILLGLLAAAEGRPYLSPATSQVMAQQYTKPEFRDITDALSGRELQVFELLGRGHAVKQIATVMHVSEKTVEANQSRIKKKLALKDNKALRLEALRYVQSLGMLLSVPRD